MTKSIIEKLEALPRYDKDGYKDSHGPWVDWIEFSAIIEDAELQSVGRVINDRSGVRTIGKEMYTLSSGTLLYTIKTKG